MLRGDPASLAGPWGPRGPRRPPGGTHVLLLERGEGGKVQSLGQGDGDIPGPEGSCQDQGSHRSGAAGKAFSSQPSPPPCTHESPPRRGAHHFHCHILLLHGAALPGSCHRYSLEFSFFAVLLNLLGASNRDRKCQGSSVPAGFPQPPELLPSLPQPRPLSGALDKKAGHFSIFPQTPPGCSPAQNPPVCPSLSQSQRPPHSRQGPTESGLVTTMNSPPALSPHSDFLTVPGTYQAQTCLRAFFTRCSLPREHSSPRDPPVPHLLQVSAQKSSSQEGLP